MGFAKIRGFLRNSRVERKGFRLGLSGGRTPIDIYRTLAAIHPHPDVWSRVVVFFADERDAPPNEPESNYWEVRKVLIEPVGIPPSHVHRMRADSPDLEAAAAEYDALLEQPLDLLVLGIGEDGHTASLFPGSPWLAERERRVVPVYDSPKLPPRRLTITPRVIHEAREVLMLASGPEKAKAVAAALATSGDISRTPARLARNRWWLVDQDAAAEWNKTR
jgi:6-phosphogluconolactonase